MKLIDLHKEWCKRKTIPTIGLCDAIPENGYSMNLFEPTDEQRGELIEEGFCQIFWASGLPSWHPKEHNAYSPLRQTIVLLICAMNNEL